MVAYKGAFTANTATGNQTVSGIVDENGNAFTPTALLLFTSYQTATSGFTDGETWQMGWTDATSQVSNYSSADDNTSPNDTDRANSTTQLCLIRNVAGTNQVVGSWVSFGSGQFVINWTTMVPVVGIRFQFVALGGSDLTAKVITTLVSNASVASDISGLSVQWQGLLTCNSGAAADAFGPIGLGWVARSRVDGSLTQGASTGEVRDAIATSFTQRQQRTDRCAIALNSTLSTVFADLGYSQLGLFYPVSGAGINYLPMELAGIVAASGSGLQPTATGAQAVTGLGFRPRVVFVMSVGNTATSSVSAEHRLSIGAADATRQGWIYVGNTDSVNPSVAVGGQSETAVVVTATPNATGASTTVTSEAAMQSLDADGFTLNWTTADATQRQYLWFALGTANLGYLLVTP